MSKILIEELTSEGLFLWIDDLAEVLHASVNSGACVNFVQPFSMDESRAFWRNKTLPALNANARKLFVAKVVHPGRASRIAGTVQIDIDMPPNQPHRCEVAKLIVHPDFRNQGIAKSLMTALEKKAEMLGKTLITLDTKSGDKAEPLYASLGYQVAGTIPDFALNTDATSYHATTYMYKKL